MTRNRIAGATETGKIQFVAKLRIGRSILCSAAARLLVAKKATLPGRFVPLQDYSQSGYSSQLVGESLARRHNLNRVSNIAKVELSNLYR